MCGLRATSNKRLRFSDDDAKVWRSHAERSACLLSIAAGPDGEACEIVQTIQLQGQAQPVSQIAVGRPAPDGPLVMVLQLPIGIWLPAGVGIELAEDDGVHQATLKLCVPAACVADLEITEAMLATLQDNPDGEGRIVFATAEGRDARLPIMFRGFASAYEALMTRFATD